MALTDKLKAIADAIRSKAGTTDTMTLDQMPDAITNLPSGGSGATEPYIEETYDASWNLTHAKLIGYTNVRPYMFYECGPLANIELPDIITSIGNYAFYNCSNLALTSLPSGITSIGTYAFQKCTGLTSITFEGTPTSIASNAFSSCTNLTTINVPWSEGAAANAPWGATNATINYNYTGE